MTSEVGRDSDILALRQQQYYYASAPVGRGHYATMTVVCLSVCPSYA